FAVCAILSLFGPSVCARGATPLITSVSVPGTTLEVNLATQVGQPYDAGMVQKDVHYLWSLGKFDDVQVEETEHPDGVGLVFHVKQAARPLLHEIRIEPHSFGLNLKIPQGAPIDLMRANQIAMEARRQLTAQGYRNARVDYRLTPAPHGETDLKLTV